LAVSASASRAPARREFAALDQVVQQVRVLAQLEPNWDGDDAHPIAPAAISEAEKIVREVISRYPLLDRSLRPFFVVGVPDGGVQMEWRAGLRSVEVEVHPDGSIECLVVDRTGDRPQFHDASPSQAVDLITTMAVAPYRA